MKNEQLQFMKVCRQIAMRQNQQVVETLESNQAYYFELTSKMQSLLHVAVSAQNLQMVEYLLAHNFGRQLADVRDINDETPLDIARRKGFLEIELTF